jgi:hypothetical protein
MVLIEAPEVSGAFTLEFRMDEFLEQRLQFSYYDTVLLSSLS